MQPVHAVVLDLNMPDMHGLDVLRFLRSHDQYREPARDDPDHARR